MCTDYIVLRAVWNGTSITQEIMSDVRLPKMPSPIRTKNSFVSDSDKKIDIKYYAILKIAIILKLAYS